MKTLLATVLLLVVPTLALAVPQTIPTPPAQQEEIFNRLAAKTHLALSHRDEEGNYLWVCFNHMPGFAKENPDAPGLVDADAPLLLHFPYLEGITLQGQFLSDEGFSVLAAFPKLKVASLPNPVRGSKGRPDDAPKATENYALALKGARDLEVLDLTHTFGVSGSCLDELGGFPKLRYLSLDVGFSGPDCLPFLAACPELEVLQLHRTNVGDDHLRQVLASLPKLRFLMIKRAGKSKDPITARSLRHLRDHPALEVFRFSHDPPELVWEDGLDHLVHVPNLKVFLTKRETVIEDGALEKLQAARPDLEISKGSSGPFTPAIVPEYPWGTGPR